MRADVLGRDRACTRHARADRERSLHAWCAEPRHCERQLHSYLGLQRPRHVHLQSERRLADSNVGTITITVASGGGGGGTTVYPSSVTLIKGTISSGGAGNLAARDGSYFQLASQGKKQNWSTEWYGSMFGIPTNASQLQIAYSGLNSRSCSQTVSIWKWSKSKWITVDTRTVDTTEVDLTGLIPSGSASQYINSGTGEVRIDIQTACTAAFTTSGDLLSVNYP